MGIGDSITLVSCLAGFMAALPAFLIFLNLVFSQTTFRAARRLEKGAVLPFFAGLIAAAGLGVPLVVLIAAGSIFQLAGVLGMLALLLWAFTGLAAIARLAGAHLGTFSNAPARPLAELVVGAVVLSLTIAFPLIGWLLILPFGLIIGLGAAVLARFSRPARQSAASPAAYDDPGALDRRAAESA